MLEAYVEANGLYPKTDKFVCVSSLKVFRGLTRNAGLAFLVFPKRPSNFSHKTRIEFSTHFNVQTHNQGFTLAAVLTVLALTPKM